MERTSVVRQGVGAFGAYVELARLLDGRVMLWAKRQGRSRIIGTYRDVSEGVQEFEALTTPIVEVR